MVFIPGGEYLRGRTHKLPDDNLKWYPTLMKDDRPVRRIHVDPFYLDEHEVTNEQYAAFVKATRHRAPYNWPQGKVPDGKEKLPVVDVSWDDAVGLREMGGQAPADGSRMGARLPRVDRGREVSMGRTKSHRERRALQRRGWSGRSMQVSQELFRAVRYCRERVGVVLGLVREGLLSTGAGPESARPRYRHVSRPARWLMGGRCRSI